MDGADRIILLVNQTAVRGRARLQKYGFLAYQLYRSDLKPLGFYSDWEAHRYGPYSADLARDLQEAERTGLIRTERRRSGGRAVDFYSLGPKGAKRLSFLLRDHGDLVKRVYETFTNLNRKSLDTILAEIYADYPQYAENSRIRDRVMEHNAEDEVRFNPEIEHMLKEIDSGNVDWEVHTPQEHIEYIKRLVRD